jgi:hypothetical protein
MLLLKLVGSIGGNKYINTDITNKLIINNLKQNNCGYNHKLQKLFKGTKACC